MTARNRRHRAEDTRAGGLTRRELLRAAGALTLGGAAARPHAARAQSSDPPAVREAKSDAERDRVRALVGQARKDGQLNWVGVLVEPDQAEKVVAEFRRYYGLDRVRVNYTYTSPGETVTKVEELLRARRADVDVVYNSAYAWFLDLKARGLLLRYDSPEYRFYSVTDRYGMLVPGYWVSDAYSFTPSWNPKLLRDRGLGDLLPFRRWRDLVNPRLKGLVSVGDVLRMTSHAQTFWALRRVLGDDWFVQLKRDVNPVTYSRSAQGRDWLVTGEFPITLSSHAKNTDVLRRQGADIALLYPEEGTVLLPFTLSILHNAPHPGAAKLFTDFLRSRRGGETLLRAGTLQFMGRPDVESPAPDLLPTLTRLKIVPIDWNKEGTSQAIQEIRDFWRRTGLG